MKSPQINNIKIALITGITGQDGSYLAELLLKKGYVVHGIKRRASSFNTSRIDHLYQDPHEQDPRLVLHYGDLTDSTNLIRIIQQVQPDEIYNLGAQCHVAVSFEAPEYTANSDALGTLRILEAVRMLGLTEKTRIYQASTSELYGLVQQIPQKETTPFYPRSPYGVAKLYAYWITVNYREACVFALENFQPGPEEQQFLNVGTGVDLTIHELAEAAAATGFQGEIRWDSSKPDGTPKKQLDVSRIAKHSGPVQRWVAASPSEALIAECSH